MDTLLVQGDHFRDARGLPVTVDGTNELVQRILIRLQVKKGSFPLDAALGSELYRLRRSGSDENSRIALAYVQEALADMPEVQVRGVQCTLLDREDLLVTVEAVAEGEGVRLEVRPFGA